MLSLDHVKGVIFDLDGTLLESSLDFSAMRRAIDCPPEQDILTFIDHLPCPVARARAHQIVIHHELEDAEQAAWLAEGRALLHHVHSLSLPTAIVTRNCRAATAIKLRRNQVPIDIVLTREDAPPKPRPEGLLMIADFWRLPADQLLYVGDYIYDRQAAENAGMRWYLINQD